MATDATLAGIEEQARNVTAGIVALYDAIREAKESGYSYNELEIVTGFPRGTLQNIAAGKNPRFSVEDRC
ncbi:hypothetical protein SEA_CHASER_139 [Mycobacterium phage Chaser]|nr:hypothetical protein SEA_CHASER_139 [Mycobacterium phage Chaser]